MAVAAGALVIDGATVQANVTEPEDPPLSVAVIIVAVDPLVGVPLMAPVTGSIESPDGRPVADHETIDAVGDESVATICSVVIGDPAADDWSPGLITSTMFGTVQVKEVDA